MSVNQTNLQFFSYVRKGVGQYINESDNLVNKSNKSDCLYRPEISLTATIKATQVKENKTDEKKQEKTFAIAGPGDVLSINPNAIMHVYPKPGETIAQGLNPYIEFWEPDFAWRYSPAKYTDDGQLSPWLALVACKENDCEISHENGKSFVVFKKNLKNILPSLQKLHLYAHAQGTTPDTPAFCRILCCSNIDAEKDEKYKAFLIPVFEIGRLRGLPSSEKNKEDALKKIPVQKPAWSDKESSPYKTPFYYSWDFKIGDKNFKDFIIGLKKNKNEQTGINIDVTNLGYGFKNNTGIKEICMPAALGKESEQEKAFPPSNSDLFNSLKNLLDQTFNDNDDPIVTPPIYGGKHILAESLGNSENPKWFTDINLDLHYRTAAGLGKKIVQKNQEDFMQRAWEQVKIINKINDEIHRVQISGKIKQRINTLCDKVVQEISNENDLHLIQKTRFLPNHHLNSLEKEKMQKGEKLFSPLRSISSRVLSRRAHQNSNSEKAKDKINFPTIDQLEIFKKNIGNEIDKCNLKITDFLKENEKKFIKKEPVYINEENIWGLFRVGIANIITKKYRLRPFPAFCWKSGEKNKLLEILINSSSTNYVEYFRTSTKGTVAVPVYLGKQVNVKAYKDSVLYALRKEDYEILFPNRDRITEVITNSGSVFFADRDFLIYTRARINDGSIKFYNDQKEIMNNEFPRDLNPKAEKSYDNYIKKVRALEKSNMKTAIYFYALYTPSSIKLDYDKISISKPKKIETYENYYESWITLQEAIEALNNAYTNKIDTSNDMGGSSDNSANSPNDTNDNRINDIIKNYYNKYFQKDFAQNDFNRFRNSKYPIMAHPIYPEPTYFYLKELSDEFVLPGIEDIPKESVTMMQNNNEFVESFLCGMNTEMGREFLWREYPTDQRGTYFKKFWDKDTDDDVDIKPIHEWSNNLGENQPNNNNSKMLVFAIRSDLLKEYPDTQITLRKASVDNAGTYKKTSENGEIKPILQAFIRDDIYIIGFPKEDDNEYFLYFKQELKNIEFKTNGNNDDNSAEYAANHINTANAVGKHLNNFE